MQIFDGKEHAKKLEKIIVDHIKSNPTTGTLAIIQIGKDPSSEKYIRIKKTFCERVGVPIQIHQIDERLSDEEILSEIKSIFEDETVRSGIIQLPLPRESLKSVLEIIPIDKDVDLISKKGLETFYNGNFEKLSPVVRAAKYFLDVSQIAVKDLDVVVVGKGDLVGKPLTYYLAKLGAKVDVLSDYDGKCKIACQLLIACAGAPNLIKGENISDNTCIIDFGSTLINGKYVGDLDINSSLENLGTCSLSPGGVGPLVVRFLVMNHVGL